MMERRDPPKPTDAELEILRALWRRGPSTVKQIQHSLAEAGSVSGASVLKLLQIMQDKGLVRRDASARAHVFHAIHTEDEVQQQLTSHLLERAFDGSAARLALRALASRASTDDELAEIEALIERYRKKEEGEQE